MHERVKFIAYVPIGEADRLDYVADTIESIYHHCTDDIVVIAMDDSGDKMHGEALQKTFPRLEIFKTEKKYQGKGLSGRHAVETVRLLKFAIERYWFDTILRVDTDALITGDNIEADLHQIFKENPGVGMVGRYWINSEGYHIDRGTGRKFFDRVKKFPYNIYFATSLPALFHLVKQARWNGYIFGELVLGATTAYNYECAYRMAHALEDFLPLRRMRGIAEDYFTTMFVKYVNMDLGNASHAEGPMCVQLRGIPFTLEETVAKNKKIIHAIKNDERYTQDEIRTYFREFRSKTTADKAVAYVQ